MSSDAGRRGVLAAATLALAMMTIDVSIVRVALPDIQNELDLSDVQQQWIVNAYLLTMGAFAIVGGRAGDRLGRKFVFLTGVVVFIVCSVLAGLAESSAMLIAARAGQGIGAAIMTPGNTAMVTDSFSGERLAHAMGVLVGVGSIGVSAGSLLGGFLVEFAGWRSIFFINVPVALIIIGLVLRYVPERRADTRAGLDPVGLVTMVAGITALTLGVMQAPSWGLGSTATIALLIGSVVALASWLAVERRVSDPLVDPSVLRGAMLGANYVAFCVPFVLSGLAVLLAIYLQSVRDHSALETGFLMLPLTIPTFIGALLAGRAMARFGARAVVSLGMAAAALGVFAAGIGVEEAERYRAMVPGIIVFGLGGGIALPAMTTILMGSVSAERRGMVSGVYNTARLFGASLGLAIMGAGLAGLESDALKDERASGKLTSVEETHVHNILAGGSGNGSLDGLSTSQVDVVKSEVQEIFDGAFATVLQLAALVALSGAIIAYLVSPRLRAPPAEQPVANPLVAEA